MTKVFDKCPNCKAKIRTEKSLFKGINRIIPKEHYQQIKEFINDEELELLSLF